MLVEAQEKISKNEQTVNINSSSLKKQQKPCKKEEREKSMWGGSGRVRERHQGNALGSPGRREGKGEKAGKQGRTGKGGEEESREQQEKEGRGGRKAGNREGRAGAHFEIPLSSSLLGITRTPHSHCAKYIQTRELFISSTSTTQEKNIQAEDKERRR